MLKVGLTGGIGSGKTTVARIFSSLGIPVYFADAEARKLMETSAEIIASVKSAFGIDSYNEAGLNRKYLAEQVFNNPAKLKKLNQIAHPAVQKQFEAWVSAQSEFPYVVEEAALLCETGAWKNFDFLVLVLSAKEKRIERVLNRDKITAEELQKRMDSQMPDDEKIPLAHYLFFNDDENMILNQALAFHEKMISLNNK